MKKKVSKKITKKKIKNPNQPEYWAAARKHLLKSDDVMAALVREFNDQAPLRKNNGFHTLVRSIVGQQISVKAADSVWNKFMKLVSQEFTPQEVLKLKEKQLRACGFSGQKVLYLYNLANFFVNEMKGVVDLVDNDHVEIGNKLIEVKGIGQWTVDMFLMFHLHAPDIMPWGDLAMVNAIKELYNIKTKDKKLAMKKMIKISDKWAPYRSAATWYLWRSLDPVQIDY